MGRVVAITGVSGQLGRVLLPLLARDSEVDRIIGIDLVPFPSELEKLTFHSRDVRDYQIEGLFAEAHIVVHLAFMMFHGPGKRGEADDVNINGSRNVFEAAASAGARKLIVASSIAAYGAHPDNDQPLTEESPIRGNADLYYSRAKAANERYLDAFCLHHPDIIVTRLRLCTVIGPSAGVEHTASYEGAKFFKTRGREWPRHYVHEDDLACAFCLAVKEDAHGAFNVAGPKPELRSELRRSLGMNVIRVPRSVLKFLMWIQWRRRRIPVPPSWLALDGGPMVVSTAKIERELGWRPRYTTRQALMATLQCIKRGS